MKIESQELRSEVVRMAKEVLRCKKVSKSKEFQKDTEIAKLLESLQHAKTSMEESNNIY